MSSLASRTTLRFVLLSAALIISFNIIFDVAASFLVVKPLDFTAPEVPVPANITFGAEVIAADSASRTLVMDWYPQFASNQCGADSPFVADIYLDPGFLDSASPSFASVPPFSPAAQLNASFLCDGVVPINRVFRTVSRLLSSDHDPAHAAARATLQQYPFDVYFAPFSLYAQDHATGALVPVNVTHSFGVAVNYELALARAVVLHGRLYVLLRVARSQATRGVVLLLALATWLLTTAVLALCAAAVVLKNHSAPGMCAVPLGAVLVLAALRAGLPGAPRGFGATIDLYTVVPGAVAAVCCSAFLVAAGLCAQLREGGEARTRVPPTKDVGEEKP